MQKDIQTKILFLRKKRQEALGKELGCKFVRINTSSAKTGYDLDCEIGNIEAFIDEFKNKKIKEVEKKLIKEKEMREKLEKEMREKLEKEMREKLEKEIKEKIRKTSWNKRIKRQK